MLVWVDVDNSPHVPFMAPIIRELRQRGHEVVVTARPYAQTLELAKLCGLLVQPVGHYGGKGLAGKLWALGSRVVQLWQRMRRPQPAVALSHGSRAQVLAAAALHIPAVVCLDYEWTERWIFRWAATRILVPEVARQAALRAGFPEQRLQGYPGLKEEVYLPDFVPEPNFRAQLGIDDGTCLVVLRPPSLTANYRTVRTQQLFEAALRRLQQEKALIGVLLPRSREDRKWVEDFCQANAIGNVWIPDRVLPGLQLLYWADAVISGGGTMNREAALLGTPTYSVFAGPTAAVDRWLVETGRLRILHTVAEIAQLRFGRCHRTPHWRYPDTGLAAHLAAVVEEVSRAHSRSRASRGMAM